MRRAAASTSSTWRRVTAPEQLARVGWYHPDLDSFSRMARSVGNLLIPHMASCAHQLGRCTGIRLTAFTYN
jgi:hypothetical protein